MTKLQHQTLAFWAADCAAHVLVFFEKEFPEDKRPREAIKACRKWARTGEFKMAAVRGASLSSHAAARDAVKDSPACFAARSAGQAMATTHVPAHAIAAAWYAVKAAKKEGRKNEEIWQYKQLPISLRKLIRKPLEETMSRYIK